MGFTRVTFVGGEPLLHPHCDALIHAAKRDFGLGTCLVRALVRPQADRCLTPARLSSEEGRAPVEAAARTCQAQRAAAGAPWVHAGHGVCGGGSQVTNGSLLTERRLRSLAGSLDVVAFSVDASEGWMHAELGRGLPHEVLGGGAAPVREGA